MRASEALPSVATTIDIVPGAYFYNPEEREEFGDGNGERGLACVIGGMIFAAANQQWAYMHEASYSYEEGFHDIAQRLFPLLGEEVVHPVDPENYLGVHRISYVAESLFEEYGWTWQEINAWIAEQEVRLGY